MRYIGPTRKPYRDNKGEEWCEAGLNKPSVGALEANIVLDSVDKVVRNNVTRASQTEASSCPSLLCHRHIAFLICWDSRQFAVRGVGLWKARISRNLVVVAGGGEFLKHDKP